MMTRPNIRLLQHYLNHHLPVGTVPVGNYQSLTLNWCLCLLDLSAAFDTIDHNILLTRLSWRSWFGIQGTALNWFMSYLSSRCFRVKCNNNLSSLHTCLCGVPEAQFLALYSLSWWQRIEGQELSLGDTTCHVYNPTQYSHLICP